jgi:hypothetical protein
MSGAAVASVCRKSLHLCKLGRIHALCRHQANTIAFPEYRSKLAPLLARTIATIVAEVEQMAARLQSSEQLLRRELQQYSKDPSAGAAQGLNSIKVRHDSKGVCVDSAWWQT